MGEFVRIVSSSPPPIHFPAVFIPLRPLLLLRLTWRDRRLVLLLLSRDQKHLLLAPRFILRDREDILSCPAFYFSSKIVVARANMYKYVCVCVCALCFILFSENSVIPSLLLHKQNEIRSPWDSNFLWLIYPAVIRASFAYFCRFVYSYPCMRMPFSSCVCIALTPRTFIPRASLFASSVRWRFRRILFFGIYCSVKSS